MITVEKGYARLPETPGIGMDPVPDVKKKFPFERRRILTRLHEDSSIVDR